MLNDILTDWLAFRNRIVKRIPLLFCAEAEHLTGNDMIMGLGIGALLADWVWVLNYFMGG